jgi:uncharacterized protein YbcI
MAGDDPTPGGDSAAEDEQSLLLQISNAMVRAQKEYFGKGPTKAKSYMLDDFLLIVMRGGITVAERTMLESDRENLVREFRQEFENEMAKKLTDMIEELTGRQVVNYQSQIMFDPDIVLEIFFFDERADEHQIAETARAQLGDGPSGEATADAAEDIPPDIDR